MVSTDNTQSLAWAQMGFATQILIHVLGADIGDRIAPKAMLVEDLGADSLDMVEIQTVLLLQGIRVPDEHFHSGMTVKALAGLIAQPADRDNDARAA